jgi:hypothetical protein
MQMKILSIRHKGHQLKIALSLTEFLQLGLELPRQVRNTYEKAEWLLMISGIPWQALTSRDESYDLIVRAIQEGDMVPTMIDLHALADGSLRVRGFGPKRREKLRDLLAYAVSIQKEGTPVPTCRS